MRPNWGARDGYRWQGTIGRRIMCLVAGLWWCAAGIAVAVDPPQPYVEEPAYETAPHLLGSASGFDTLFSDGMLLSAAVRVPTNLLDRPGHQLVGGTWNSRTYASIAEAYIPYPPVPTPTTGGSWCLHWNFDQFLFVDPADSTRGFGPFGRAGIADASTSPIDAFLSFGLGGNAFGRTRRDDTFGVGWYWASASPRIGTLITAQFGPVGDGQGFECFYNYAVSRAVRVTPDVQYVVPSLRSAEPSLIVGTRALVSF